LKSYIGKIAKINLNNNKIEYIKLEETLLKKFLGGSGLAIVLYMNFIAEKIFHPFSSENPLIFLTGPLTGTIAPTSGRHVVASRSPLTNIWGEALAGGFFGARLKMAGFDGLVILGSSSKPVYILINDGSIEIHDGKEIWGYGTYDTMEVLRKDIDRKVSVACIGPAGENLVKYAAIINDNGRAAARTGLGAIMGSKKLKAIAVIGSKEVEVKNEEFIEYCRELSKELANSDYGRTLRELGSSSYFEVGYEFGDIPGKYFTSQDFDFSTLSGIRLNKLYKVSPIACYSCPIGCGRKIKRNSIEIDGPEYETLASLGALNLIQDIDAIVLANHYCNDFGLDTISTGVVIAFLNYLVEKGKIKKNQINTSWGDGNALKEIIKMIAYRKGIGNILAEGVRKMAETFNIESDLAAHVKGLEIPMHDPRAFFSVALSYSTSPRGACHLRSDAYLIDLGTFEDAEFNIISGNVSSLLGKAGIVASMQNLREIFNSAILCLYSSFKSKQVLKLLNLAIGWNMTIKDLYIIGERIFNMKRVFNNLCGITRKDDYLPKIVLEPYKEGPIKGITPMDQYEQALKEYYEFREWDWETGKPKKEKLINLELKNTIKLLEY
jgi:aldehyde:ferredoxin oxidoreductase